MEWLPLTVTGFAAVAATASAIAAWRQWKVSRNNLLIALHPQRLSLFYATKSFVDAVVVVGANDDTAHAAFLPHIHDATFIAPKEMYDAMLALLEAYDGLREGCQDVDGFTGNDRQRVVESNSRLRQAFKSSWGQFHDVASRRLDLSQLP